MTDKYVRLPTGVLSIDDTSWFQITQRPDNGVLLEFIHQPERLRWYVTVRRGRTVEEGKSRFLEVGEDDESVVWTRRLSFLDCHVLDAEPNRRSPTCVFTFYREGVTQPSVVLDLPNSRLLVEALVRALAAHDDPLGQLLAPHLPESGGR
jgi:hypothetical protein